MKKMSLFLALCLLFTALPVSAFAEEAEVYQAEEAPGEALGETGALGLFAVTEDDGDVDWDWSDDEVVSEEEEASVSALPEEETSVAPEVSPAEAEAEPTAEPAAEAEPEESEAEETEQPPTPHVDPNGPQPLSNEISLGVKESLDLKPVMPEGVAGGFTCESSDENIATVTAEGVVSAVAVGDAVLTFTAEDGAYTECFVHVKKAPDKVKFAVKTFYIGKGERTAPPVIVGSAEGVYAGAYKLTSKNSKVVKVYPDGTVKGLKTGKTTLTVKTYNGKKATCKVKVVKAPKKVTATIDKKTIGVGETAQMGCKLPDGTASQPKYTSKKPSVAIVDEVTGEVTGVAPGTAKIYVKTFNGKKSHVTVKVLPAPTELAFPEETVKLGVGMKLDFAASVDEGAAGRISYKVKKKSVATYKSGTLKGVKKGTTVLEASTYNGLTAECSVKVLSAPKKVTLEDDKLTIGVKQTVQLEPDVGNSVGGFTYSSSNKKVAMVSKGGVVKGVKKGTATITIKTYNKKSVKLKLTVKKAPKSIKLSDSAFDLGIDETARISFTLPKDTCADVTYSIKDKTVAKLDASSGKLTGLAPGETTLKVVTHNGKTASAKIRVYDYPEWIEADTSFVELPEGETYPLQVSFSPDSRSALKFTSDDKSVATVSSDGVITGKDGGETVIHISTNVPDVSADVSVKVLPAPKKVTLDKTELELDVGDTTQLMPVITPEDASTTFTYTTSDKKVATVSKDGTVVAVDRGTATLTVETHNGKKAKLTLTVVDPWYPGKVSVKNAPSYMDVDSELQLEFSVTPKTAIPDLVWNTSNKDVAWVDSDDVLHTADFGYALLTATSKRNSDIKLEFTVGVETNNVTLAIPARITDVSGIKKNLAMIEAIHTSAINQLKSMYTGGVISKDDASKRKSMVDNAFKDYAFPWMTPALQKYWKAENSEGGVKDFKPDRVYYGMPYISGSGNNRAYNVAKALSEGRYKDSGEGYYVLNQKNLLNGKYCGNDCSCFVDAAIWGTNSGHSNDRTSEIATSSAYRTIDDFKSMRTGDLICKGYAHVVMFLYYANEAKTKVMIIENGGIEPGTNTVHCMVMDVSYYTGKGYKVRRLKGLG